MGPIFGSERRKSRLSRQMLVVAGLCLQGCASHTVSFWSENEAWATGPIGISNYSNGLNLTWSPVEAHRPCEDDCEGRRLRRFVDLVNVLDAGNAGQDQETWLRYGVAQQFFTPDDITIDTLQPDDRPYAGYLYASLDIVNEKTQRGGKYSRNLVGLRAGVIGPASLGADMQRLWHRVCTCKDPAGWHLQLQNEAGFVYTLGHERQLLRGDLTKRLSYDLIASAQASIGNFYTGVDLAGTARLGWNLNSRWGAKSMADINYDDPHIAVKPEFFLFAGFAGRHVFRDVFVDGNTFRDSHSVSRTPLVLDQVGGFGWRWKRLEFRATLTHRSKQYRTQAASTRFGSVALTWRH